MSVIYKFKVANANYDKVFYYIDKMLSENEKYCGCPRCRMDAAAIALNTLPPHYYVENGNKDDKDFGSPWLLIEVAVREAMTKVLGSPHHPPKESGLPEGMPDAFFTRDTGTGG